MKKSLLLLLCLALVATACGGSAEETVEEPVATEEVETLEAPATTACLLYTSPSPRDRG